VLADIVPPQVAADEAFGNLPDAVLFPEEEAVVARAVDKRRREFAAARACARAGLARLGVPPAPILPGLRGAPQWPPGIVGSMTHCAGYRASAVARAADMLTVGLDAEPDDRLPDGVLQAVATADELAGLAALVAMASAPSWDRLLFCAKEAVYKAWFPLTRRWLGFMEAAITINPADGTFAARLLVEGPVLDGRRLTGFTGRWLAGDGLIVTAIAVPRRSPSGRPDP
jgi:4'-phosphopantetheinyl transferase EntD